MLINLNKLKTAFKEKRLIKSIYYKIYPYFVGLIFLFKKKKIKVSINKLNKIDLIDLSLSAKIFESYKKMKNEQEKIGDLYKPSSLWQKHLDKDYEIINNSIKNNDLEEFLFFLQNFGNWKNYLGIESHDLIQKYNSNILLKSFLEESIFGGQLRIWKYFNNNKNDFSDLNMPRFGNQIGATIDGNFIVIGSFFNDIYSSILNEYSNINKKTVIAELGGGYGKFAYYFIKKVKNYSFINFDIPEVLVLSMYYLIKSFPSKNYFLFGDKIFDNSLLDKYDLLFLPSWEIEKINNDYIDIFINQTSLGEINPEAAKNYINHICRISKLFFSSNHETFRNKFENQKFSLINKEYPISKNFQLLVRYPDIGHMTYQQNKINFDSDIFFYIYKKTIKSILN
jgi:putative sugar O-methyltransferase